MKTSPSHRQNNYLLFRFLYLWILIASFFFLSVGICVALFGDSILFDRYNSSMSILFLNKETFPISYIPFKSLLFAILGTSICGKWLLAACIIHYALKKQLLWSLKALAFGLLSWFIVESLASALSGAYFNILFINLIPLIGFGLPLVIIGLTSSLLRHIAPKNPQTKFLKKPRLYFMTSIVTTIVIGLVIAFFGHTPLFYFYNNRIELNFFPNGMPFDAARMQYFLMGPIGGTTVGHMAMMFYIAKYAFHEKWARLACLISLFAWAIPDSVLSIYYGAFFNVLMFNIPSLLLLTPPLFYSLVHDPLER